MYDDLIAHFNLPRIEHRIIAFNPLPPLGAPFDLITAFDVCFTFAGQASPWETPEWEYFLNDCRTRVRPGGTIRLELNRGKCLDYQYMSDQTARDLRQSRGVSLALDKSCLIFQSYD